MKMKIRIRSLIPVCMALAVHTASAQVQPVDYVDMFMGNRGESNCVIGPQLSGALSFYKIQISFSNWDLPFCGHF